VTFSASVMPIVPSVADLETGNVLNNKKPHVWPKGGTNRFVMIGAGDDRCGDKCSWSFGKFNPLGPEREDPA